jgi:hypothetical protein
VVIKAQNWIRIPIETHADPQHWKPPTFVVLVTLFLLFPRQVVILLLVIVNITSCCSVHILGFNLLFFFVQLFYKKLSLEDPYEIF